MNNDFHQLQNYQKSNEYQFINNMFFGAKKTEINKRLKLRKNYNKSLINKFK